MKWEKNNKVSEEGEETGGTGEYGSGIHRPLNGI